MASNSDAISWSSGIPLLSQSVDVGFGEDATLARNRMEFDAGVTLITEFCSWNLELRIDLVDDGACTAGALIVHRRNFFLAASVFVLFEDDDLGVLPAQLNDRIHLGVHLLHGKRHCGHFLHKLGAYQVSQRASARAGDEDATVVGSNAYFLLPCA